jgi:BirA family biotin operon repressor/biotin-[acetyl-CoA-carboxylase] ligase
LEHLLQDEGFSPIRIAWLDKASNVNRPVTARMPGRTVAGLFETIDETGAIVIDTGAGRVTLAAADLHLA